MKPVAFDYAAPVSVEAALGALAEAKQTGVPLAGGYSLMPLVNARRTRPDTVIDLNRVPGLDEVRQSGDAVHVGAMTRLRTLETDPALRLALPVLAEAAGAVGHLQIRLRATVGGSLCHADPAAELPALAVALGARLHLRSAYGSRVEEAADFYRGPFRTTRLPTELLTAVEFPPHRGFTFGFAEVPRRGEAGFPLVAAFVGVRLEGGAVAEARISAAGVADRPVRLPEAEAALTGWSVGGDLTGVLDAAAREADPVADVHGDQRYRRALLRAVLRRAVAKTSREERA